MNPVLKLDRYPIPKVEDIFVVLAGGKLFSKIDLSQAYQQLPLDEENKAVCSDQYPQEAALWGLIQGYFNT